MCWSAGNSPLIRIADMLPWSYCIPTHPRCWIFWVCPMNKTRDGTESSQHDRPCTHGSFPTGITHDCPTNWEFARRAGGQVVTSVVCNRSQPDPLGIVLLCGKIGICGGKTGHRTTLSFRTSAHTGVGISIEFWAVHRHTDCLFCAVSRNSSTRNCTNQEIATPVTSITGSQ